MVYFKRRVRGMSGVPIAVVQSPAVTANRPEQEHVVCQGTVAVQVRKPLPVTLGHVVRIEFKF